MSLQDLPAEILLICFQEFNTNCYVLYRFYALASIRLTCRRFAELVVPLLFSKIKVPFLSTSLQRLEKLSQNPSIAESITHVTLGLPCYDPIFLNDFSCFVYNRATILELYEIAIWGDPTTTEIYEEIEEQRRRVVHAWFAIGDGHYAIDNFDQNMTLMHQSHQNYQKLYRDRRECKSVTLLSEILRRLKNLQRITIFDSLDEDGHVDEKGFLVMPWNSGYMPAALWTDVTEFGPSTVTPWKLIADIFDALEMASVHPSSFELELQDALLDSRAFQMSPECLIRISDVLRGTKSIFIYVDTSDNQWDNTEFVGLLTRAMCDVASLQVIDLSFCMNFGPHTATSVLPLGKTTWEILKSLKLQHIALSREEFQTLLKQCNKDVLEDVQLHNLSPRSLSRQDACDDLKSFEKVRNIAWTDSRRLEFD